MRHGAGHGQAESALAAAALAGDDEKVTLMHCQVDIMQNGHFLFIVYVGKMFYGNKRIRCRFQLIITVIRNIFFFFSGIKKTARSKKTVCRKIHDRRNDTVQQSDNADERKHPGKVHFIRQI